MLIELKLKFLKSNKSILSHSVKEDVLSSYILDKQCADHPYNIQIVGIKCVYECHLACKVEKVKFAVNGR